MLPGWNFINVTGLPLSKGRYVWGLVLFLTFYKITACDLVSFSDYRIFFLTYSLIFAVSYQAVAVTDTIISTKQLCFLIDILKLHGSSKEVQLLQQGSQKYSLPSEPLAFSFLREEWMFNMCVQVHVEQRCVVWRGLRGVLTRFEWAV